MRNDMPPFQWIDEHRRIAIVGVLLLAALLRFQDINQPYVDLKLVGMATPGWVTTVIGVSLILMVGVAILSFVGLALTILVGSQTAPAPSANYPSFIARISKFGVPGTSTARPLPIVERS